MSDSGLINLTKADIEIQVTRAVWERGLEYWQQGYLIAALRLSDCLAGQVLSDHGVYRVRLWIEATQLRGECNCPYPGFCKHLVALALGWLEQRERFIDLQPELDKLLVRSEQLPQMLERLAIKDPLSFWETLAEQSGQSGEAINSRTMITLIRRLFDRPVLTRSDAESLWERLNRAKYWLAEQLPEAGPELLGLAEDLLKGTIAEFRQSNDGLLRSYLADLLQLFRTLPQFYETAGLERLFSSLCSSYFNPELWELAGDLRQVLVAFLTKDPVGFREGLVANQAGPVSLMVRVAWYELLVALPKDVKPVYRTEYRQVVDALLAEEEGRLWLADRLLETDRNAACRLIMANLRQAADHDRPVWCDRLIRMHQLNGEWRQATAICMTQFNAAPSFEEYLRLKACLEKCPPGDQVQYWQRMQCVLFDRAERELWLRIVIDRQDTETINTCCDEIVKRPVLLDCLAEVLNRQPLVTLAAVYPAVIYALAARENVTDWNRAWQTTVTFKKLCYQNQLGQQWEECRMRLVELDPARLKSLKRFGGAILSS